MMGIPPNGLTPVPGAERYRRGICHCPNCTPQRPCHQVLDSREVDRLCRHLGIREPVHVRFGPPSSRPWEDWSRTNGTTGWEDRGGRRVHTIYLNEGLGVEYANETLCHELRHCEQQEKLDPTNTLYFQCDRLYGYDANPFEVDAESAGAVLSERFRMVVA